MTDSVRTRIRKLLALAGNNSNEHEAAVALAKAQALMEEYNIELGDEENFEEGVKLEKGDIFIRNLKLPYHRVIAAHVAMLYDCKHLIYQDIGGHSFWGMSHSIEAAEETFLWIVAQVEDLYQVALKAFDGRLSKAQRAELRSSFKDACAVRVAQRIHGIVNARATSRDSRALVVVSDIAQKIQDELDRLEMINAKAVTLRTGFGTQAGYNAGDHVRIQKEVKRSA